ncbi:MAG: glutamate formimidoyltransferase [Candidatus Zixiibacteriota bacterium]|nr:MAG: glutamate formimidoyltransferase [candidate division Zixibacteria bacterium]
MSKLVECVPNFSEGRDPKVIAEILAEIESVEGVQLLDQEMDKDHNRAVVTMVGEPEPAKEAAFRAIAKAAELIDMEKHTGEHPRMGATDVCPFIPISGLTMDECVQMARELGERVGKELEIPVYLYEAAASRPERENLADVRRGEYEGIRDSIATEPGRKPDFGPSRTHPRAGAIAIGARPFLIAFNVYLDTQNLRIAKDIANAIRHAQGGYRFVKAMGFEIKERRQVQISMNLVNYVQSPIFRVFETIKSEARRYGVAVVGSEIVGLTPLRAITKTADFYLQLENFKMNQVLEYKLKSRKVAAKEGYRGFLELVAAKTATPGGGSVSALAGALAGALGSMVSRLTVGKKKYANVEKELSQTLNKTETLRSELAFLVEKDAQAFDQVMTASKMPKATDFEKKQRDAKLQEATIEATSVPLEVMEKAVAVMEHLPVIAEKGNVNSISDVGVASLMAISAVKGAHMNVKINLPGIDDEKRRNEFVNKADVLLKKAEKFFEKAEKIVKENLG